MTQLTVEESNLHLDNIQTLSTFPVGTQVVVDRDVAPRPRYGRVVGHLINSQGEIVLTIEMINLTGELEIEHIHPENQITRVMKIGK